MGPNGPNLANATKETKVCFRCMAGWCCAQRLATHCAQQFGRLHFPGDGHCPSAGKIKKKNQLVAHNGSPTFGRNTSPPCNVNICWFLFSRLLNRAHWAPKVAPLWQREPVVQGNLRALLEQPVSFVNVSSALGSHWLSTMSLGFMWDLRWI